MTTAFARWAAAFVLAGLCAAAASPAQAHPHVWVTVRSTAQFDAAGLLTGIRHAWTFDEAFAAYATAGLDSDKDGRLSRGELAPLAKVNVESLHEFKYFTSYMRGREEWLFTDPVDYFLDHDGKTLTLHFTLPLKQPARPKTGDKVEVYDPSFFVSYEFAATDPVRVEGAAGGCALYADRPDPAKTSRLSQLGESFFNSLQAGNGVGAEIANRFRFVCP